MSPLRTRIGRWVTAALAVVSLGGPVRAQVDPTVLKGVEYLRPRAGVMQVGESALTALAMLKAEIPANDPAVAACLSKIRTRFGSGGGYNPERQGGTDIYEAAVVCLALSNLDAESRRSELETVARYLISKQNANGSWDYTGRPFGDTSISQYAVLGLWEADNGGVAVPPQVWDRAAQWFLSSQSSSGSWNYHRDEGDRYPETISMTAAGVGSLLICHRQLARLRGGSEGSRLLKPLAEGAQPSRYDPTVSLAKIDQAVKQGIGWIGSHFSSASSESFGQSAFYALYGIERIGALADKDTLGRVNWFEEGRQFIRTRQQLDGGWTSAHGEVPNTVWAILFLTRSTAKTIRRVDIKRLGAGTLLGGRGLPKDLGNLTVSGGRVVSRPMSGAVEGMLAVLEDPRSENADAALAGLVSRYRVEGAAVLRPHIDRFRKLLIDPDPGLRRVAAWSLARVGDLDLVPLLIKAVEDPDASVGRTAREGLQLISRKIEGFGSAAPATPEERKEIARLWTEWYESVRPIQGEIGGALARPQPSAGGADRR